MTELVWKTAGVLCWTQRGFKVLRETKNSRMSTAWSERADLRFYARPIRLSYVCIWRACGAPVKKERLLPVKGEGSSKGSLLTTEVKLPPPAIFQVLHVTLACRASVPLRVMKNDFCCKNKLGWIIPFLSARFLVSGETSQQRLPENPMARWSANRCLL